MFPHPGEIWFECVGLTEIERLKSYTKFASWRFAWYRQPFDIDPRLFCLKGFFLLILQFISSCFLECATKIKTHRSHHLLAGYAMDA